MQELSGGIDQPVREPPSIPTERLRECLRERYGLEAAAVAFLPRGRDYAASVFHVVDERGEVYLLKVTTRPLYEPSYLVPRFLNEQGISEAVAPMPATDGVLWTTLGAWRATVYPFIDGDTSWAGMTRVQWRQVGDIFRRIHALRPAPERLADLGPPRRETFNPSDYIGWAREFEAQILGARPGASESMRVLRAAWTAHQPAIHAIVTSLETLAAALASRTVPQVICHADLHAANLLRAGAGRVFVIDWDEVLLAPKERDFIFVREAPSDAFWDGYGAPAVDWVALAYFRYERVIQDVIEDARQVCVRDDLGEAVRLDIARTFDASFATGGNLDAAYAAADHLPPEIGIARAAGS